MLNQVRERLGSLLSDRPQFPDVVGGKKKLLSVAIFIRNQES